MALSEIEIKRCEKALAVFMERRRPPPAIRSQLDMVYKMSGHSVEIFEVQPHWQDHSKTMKTPVARVTFVRTKNHWKVFWMRHDLKWHGYPPKVQVASFEASLGVVDRDEHCCCFG